MAKKKHEHGPLYEHAKRELELAGLSNPKGETDQTVYSTVLRLIDTFERGGKNEFMSNTIKRVFQVLADGELLTNPTDNPDEWKHYSEANITVNRRCNFFFTKDGGQTWYRPDNGAQGVSKEVTPKEVNNDGNEETSKENV